MNKKTVTYWSIIVDALLICCGALAVVFSVPSSYGVEFEKATLVYVAVLCSVFLSAVLHLKKKPLALLLLFLAAAALYAVLDRGSVSMGARIVYYTIMRPPSSIFPFLPIPAEPVVSPLAAPACATSFLIVVCTVFAPLIALSVIKCSSPFPAMLPVLPAVFISMVYTDCQPALYALILLLVYFGGVLLGSGIRGTTKKHATARLVFLALLFLLAFVLRTLSPEKQFVPIPYEQRRTMLGERIGRLQDDLLSLFQRNPQKYGLDAIGDRLVNDSKAFSVRSSIGGSFLMRTHSYGHYSQNSFLPSPEYDGEWRSLHALGATQKGDTETIAVQGALTNERIVPYAFSMSEYVKVEEGFVRSYGETSYSWFFKPFLRFTPVRSDKAENDYYSFALKNYTMPAGAQKERLIKLMDNTFFTALSSVRGFSGYIGRLMQTDHYGAALAVAESVRSLGEYTLTPGAVPSGKDFVEYFVSENKKGYCVHYATTTAAFLQALDIPARFVIGYRADVEKADTWQQITKQASHAWVEVYVKGVGWVPIECTPGFPDNSNYAPYGVSYPVVTPTPDPEPTPTPTPDPNAPTERPDFVEPTPNSSRGPRESATPKPSPTPNIGGSGGSLAKKGGFPLWLLIIPAAAALWQLAGFIINRLRKRRFEQSDPNAAVLAMLRYLRRLERFGGPKQSDAKELSEEAAFSDHSMRDKQQELIKRCRSVQRSAFKKKPLKRFFLRRMIFIL